MKVLCSHTAKVTNHYSCGGPLILQLTKLLRAENTLRKQSGRCFMGIWWWPVWCPRCSSLPCSPGTRWMKNVFTMLYAKIKTNNQTSFWRGYSPYATQYTLIAAWEQLDAKTSKGRSYFIVAQLVALIVAPISEARNGSHAQRQALLPGWPQTH